jgi:hypothetical protein
MYPKEQFRMIFCDEELDIISIVDTPSKKTMQRADMYMEGHDDPVRLLFIFR